MNINLNLEGSLIALPFSKTVSIGSALGSKALDHVHSFRYEFTPIEKASNTIKGMDGYSPKQSCQY